MSEGLRCIPMFVPETTYELWTSKHNLYRILSATGN